MAEPKTLSDIKLAGIYKALPELKQWIIRVEEETHARHSRKEVIGLKLVAGRRRRAWNCSDEDVKEALLDLFGFDAEQSMEVKPLSPAKVEALVGKERMGDLDALIEWTEAAPRLVPVNDPRPEYKRDDFDELMKGLKDG